MQYILTEEELLKLREKASNFSEKARTIINDLCKDVADYKPTFKGWDGTSEARPWGCRHSKKGEHYCDECSVRNICMMQKHFSK